MTETELLTAVTSGTKKRPGLCKLLGVRYYHPYDSRHCVPGFPDLFLVGTRGTVFRELKSETGTLEPAQREWRDALRDVGHDWDIWRPSDFASGRIADELAALMGKLAGNEKRLARRVAPNWRRNFRRLRAGVGVPPVLL